MKFSREQELFLIGLGIDVLLSYRTSNNVIIAKVKKPRSNKGTKWTPEQRRKFSETMKKKWRDKKHGTD